ncbi:MAG TPA: hypothetical protein PLV13_00535 [Ilumatobacteraceae bacterium]|nr:hypothetical protein [Ilumatobacteraceae bacterium]
MGVHVDLFAHEGGFTPRPAYQVIEAARQQRLTGELALATAPTTRVYLRDGEVYFAERATDSALGVRLLVAGVLSRPQLDRAITLVEGVEHLGRMFERDASIDRHGVEVAIEHMTDEALAFAAPETVAGYRMALYRRHPSGIDRWGDAEGEPPAQPAPAQQPAAPAPVQFAPPSSPPVQHAAIPVLSPIAAAPGPITARLSAVEAVRAIATSGLADEVANAVREALAAIESAAQPDIPLMPSDFGVAQPVRTFSF